MPERRGKATFEGRSSRYFEPVWREVPDETIATTIDFLRRAEKKVLG